MSELPLTIQHTASANLSVADCLDCTYSTDAATWAQISLHIERFPNHRVGWTTTESRTSLVAAAERSLLTPARDG